MLRPWCDFSAERKPKCEIFDIGERQLVLHSPKAMTDLPERLRKLLQKHVEEWQASQADLAEHLGIGRSAVSRMISGERQISAVELIGILKFFGLSFEQLEKALSLSDDDKLELYLSSISHSFTDPYKDNLKIEPYITGSSAISIPTIVLGSTQVEKHSRLRWMRLYDDTMNPTIAKGDIVIIDESVKGATGLYALEGSPGSYSVRRLDSGRWEAGELLVHVGADNSRVRSYETPLSSLKVIGLVLVRITDRL